MKTFVVRTGIANLASVLAALRRAGADPIVTSAVKDVEDANHLILPGVGAFGAAMEALEQADLISSLRARITSGKPTLAICLGLQLLAESSEESAGVQGLGVIRGAIQRFGDNVRVPQLGWNEVTPDRTEGLLQPGFAYFANSYRLLEAPQGWRAAYTDHGGSFVSAFERGSVLACQFHPELSGAYGAQLIERWLRC